MRQLAFSHNQRVIIAEGCTNPNTIDARIAEMFEICRILPDRLDAHIIIKPNLNNDINGLMGNATDLRVLAGVLRYLHSRGYSQIAIAEGPNGGTVRRGIDVFRRLRVDRLAAVYGATIIDVNSAPARRIQLPTGDMVEIADLFWRAGIIINLPKIKTHWETGLTLSTKNLMGCIKGLSKKVMHNHLVTNLLAVNSLVVPAMHIVDGLLAMEGQGPGDGRPKRLNLLVAGTDNYLVDGVITKLVGFDLSDVTYIHAAIQTGHLTADDIRELSQIRSITKLIPSHQSRITKLATHRRVTAVRNALRPVFQYPLVNRLLVKLGIMQDIYVEQDDKITALDINSSACTDCDRCINVCPMKLNPRRQLNERQCIGCLYCVMVCPTAAITWSGQPGFLASQMNRFGNKLKKV
ncbi:MAG: DUF362 domain-containing protein [Patescibacteria group bacterium]|nr:DUF362 domain-containing protein [Patescibacteria group bacterium]